MLQSGLGRLGEACPTHAQCSCGGLRKPENASRGLMDLGMLGDWGNALRMIQDAWEAWVVLCMLQEGCLKSSVVRYKT